MTDNEKRAHDPTFTEWLYKFIGTDTNLGDLATDIKKDSTFPNSSDKQLLLSYIENRTSNEVIHNTLAAAIDLYHAADGVYDRFSHRDL